MPKNSTATEPKTEAIIITPEVHEAIREWYFLRKGYISMAAVAKSVGMDTSHFHKVLNQQKTAKDTTYKFNDEHAGKLYALTVFLGNPCNLPKKRNGSK